MSAAVTPTHTKAQPRKPPKYPAGTASNTTSREPIEATLVIPTTTPHTTASATA